MSRRARILAAALALLAALPAACGAERAGAASAREAWDRYLDAVSRSDGPEAARLYDSEARASRTQKLRDLRARIERGDPADAVLAGTGMSVEDLRRDDAGLVGAFLVRSSPIARDMEWFRKAKVGPEEADGDAAARILLRGADGTERGIWFLRERDGWVLDVTRTYRRF